MAVFALDLSSSMGEERRQPLWFSARAAYPRLLSTLRAALARSLAVDPQTFAGLGARAALVKDLTNDYAFEGFAMRASAFESGVGDVEGVASVLLHKPAHNWSDRDREQALSQMVRYRQQFRELRLWLRFVIGSRAPKPLP